jgi:hypothetical protein
VRPAAETRRFLLLLVALLTACNGGNKAPVAHSFELRTAEDVPVTGQLAGYQDEGARLKYYPVSVAQHGRLSLDAIAGDFTFLPDADFFGIASFMYVVDNGRRRSQPATVSITVDPVSDAPRFADIPDLTNSADDPVTRWVLGASDPDSTQMSVVLAISDSTVANVQYDEVDDAIEITVEDYGEAAITVSVSDGELTTEKAFTYRASRVTRAVDMQIPTPETSAIVIKNVLEESIELGLGWNDKTIYETRADMVAAIGRSSATSADFVHDLWRFVSANVYHNHSFAGERWEHDPLLLVNSIGFGLCDDVASAFSLVVREAGLSSRVWALSGHVVPEVWIDGRWQMYDPDIEVYYRDHQGRIAGVEALAADPTLVVAPVQPLYQDPSFYGYRQFIADIYATTGDNWVEPWYDSGAPPVRGSLVLPPGASAVFPGIWAEGVTDRLGDPVPVYSTIRLILPRDTRQVVPLPLVLRAVRGDGTVVVANRAYSISSPTFQNLLVANPIFLSDIEILDATTDIELVLLLNPLDAALMPLTTVRLTGLKVWGLDVSTVEIPEEESAVSNSRIPTFPLP